MQPQWTLPRVRPDCWCRVQHNPSPELSRVPGRRHVSGLVPGSLFQCWHRVGRMRWRRLILGSYCYERPVVPDVAPTLTRPPGRSIIVALTNGSYRFVYPTDVTASSAFKRGIETLLTIYRRSRIAMVAPDALQGVTSRSLHRW